MRRLNEVAGALAAIALWALAAAGPALAYPTPTVDLTGHGWGHGRGMGQYGALGYAINLGWTDAQILNHFYGGTSAGSISNTDIGVRLTRFDGLDTIAANSSGQLHTTADGGAGSYGALRAVLGAAGTFQVYSGPGCAGPWSLIAAAAPAPLRIYPSAQSDNLSDMVQACEPSGTIRWLRGDLRAVSDSGTQRTVNHLPIESYLRGVVPRESPASWAALGGGTGANALRAQAVAARSYADSDNRYAYASTCDSTACQVYGGRAMQDSSGFTSLEDPSTDAAVAATAGVVRVSGGMPARTEYSSSTGGWTAGGQFPAVVDDGDAVSQNPNHSWGTSVAVSDVESAWPQIGRLVTLQVTSRNGFGDFGGRVLQVAMQGTAGQATVSGSEFESKLGLKSDWFQILYPGGYWLVARDGGIFAFGNASFYGSTGSIKLNQPIVGMAPTPAGSGYWLTASDGGVFAFGDGGFYGSAGSIKLNRPIVGMVPTPAGKGYWMVASDGGIFAFGDAAFHGSMGGTRLNQPIIAMASTPSGNGYWMVASDGGVFAFGDAAFHGSMGGTKLNQPIVGMAATPSGNGYWMVASDGGIFAFGDAAFFGSTGGTRLNQPIVGLSTTPTGNGYWMVASDGGVFAFGDAAFFGSMGGTRLNQPIVGMARHKVPTAP